MIGPYELRVKEMEGMRVGRLILAKPAAQQTGISTPLKTLTYRGIRKLGLIPVPPRRAYVTSLRINPDAPGGFERINDGPILTEFSKKEFTLQRDQGGRVSAVAVGKTR